MYGKLLYISIFTIIFIVYCYTIGESFEGTFLDDDEEMNIVGTIVDSNIENTAGQEENRSFINTTRRVPYTYDEIKNAISGTY